MLPWAFGFTVVIRILPQCPVNVSHRNAILVRSAAAKLDVFQSERIAQQLISDSQKRSFIFILWPFNRWLPSVFLLKQVLKPYLFLRPISDFLCEAALPELK